MQGTNKEDIKNPIDAVEFRPAGDPRSGHFISFLVTTHSIICTVEQSSTIAPFSISIPLFPLFTGLCM